jgi:hypothetical protein
MIGGWFANRGQVVQTFAASLSAAVALVVLYFLLKNNNSLPKTSSVLYVLGITSLFLIGFVFRRRSASRTAPLKGAADKPFAPIQEEALRLPVELLAFLKRLGPAPAPKYTGKEIDNMTSVRMKELINAKDGDFLESVEYYRPGGIAFTPQGLVRGFAA